MQQVNLTNELARLLIYISQVGVAHETAPPTGESRLQFADMFLADSLRSLHDLGIALLASDPSSIANLCDDLIGYFTLHTNGMDGFPGVEKQEFDRFTERYKPHHAIAILQDIKRTIQA